MPEVIPHILIADDELSMRELLEYMLNKEGYRISCAENGRKAIEIIESTPFDLLICDIRPGDISGLEVLKAAIKINPQAAVIMIFAYTTTETAVESMNEGAFDFIPKPFINQELKDTITNALTLKTVRKYHRQFSQNAGCL